jgi:hypothetical protein
MKAIVSASILLLASIPAQTPPTGTHVPVGIINQVQPYSGYPSTAHAGEQRIRARVLPGDDAPGQSFGAPAVRIGRRLWWLTASIQVQVVPPAPPTFHPVGGSPAVVLAVASFQWTNYVLPGAATGFDHVFMPAGFLLVSPSLITQATTNQFGGGIAVPTGGYDLAWLYWDVPNDPALIGQVVGCQAARIDPFNGIFYLSDEHLTEIR